MVVPGRLLQGKIKPEAGVDEFIVIWPGMT